MKRLGSMILVLSLGAACGPTKPGEIPPLAPRPDPGLPLAPAPVPGVPGPDQPSTPGPSLEPTYPPRDAGVPVTSAPAPISHVFSASGEALPAAADAGIDARRPPDAAAPPDGPVLPPIPDGGVPADANRLVP